GVEREDLDNQGAGDQGMMFGYAVKESQNLMPYSIELAHKLLIELAAIRREGKQMTYLRPDSKILFTIEYGDDNVAKSIDTIVISTQHDEFIKADTPEKQLQADKDMVAKITEDVKNILIPRLLAQLSDNEKALFKGDYKLLVNPTGKFVIGGPHGDTGLTGRKIIVDTYGGKGAHGGGAFSGKDPSKVDRSAAYATRHIAKNLVAAGIADECLVQVAYAIGVAQPVGLYVNTYGTSKVKISDGEIAQKLLKIFDLRPAAIIKRLKLKNPIYLPTAAYGHFGREPYTENGIEFFTWEKLDYVDTIKKEFAL
ncbi:MAG: methionine adenosyltransferase, partial [Bacteroidales bacterium]|nr:methionine adenosyltransferase [Bacteroidales bacterium]